MNIKIHSSTQLHPLEIEGEVVLPNQFTYPFQYTPHPLAVIACERLKAYIKSKEKWKYEISLGKMFGVLVVKKSDANLAVIWAFSGLLDTKNIHAGFVPPVYDTKIVNEYYNKEDAEICKMADGEEKSNRSRALQMWLFHQFRFLNANGEITDLCDIFDKETCRIPPSGAGECCAPKLLQYAYSNNLHPLCMAEFWLGTSPRGEIRYDGEYYPACHAKCKPILHHMLTGLDVEENPLLTMMKNAAKHMRIIYDDEAVIVVDKPAGMLAVRGNVDAPSVESIIQEKYPEISGPLIVHRLDMDTSGIMIIAKNKDIHKALQTQFFKHEIHKRYVAILDGTVKPDKGIITLSLSPNKFDRPRQMVDYKYGKEAITEFEVLERNEGKTRIAFYPQTGRTHQLRVHAAHKDGLDCPIVGDRLYSQVTNNCHHSDPSERMCLHAESIDFTHPISNNNIHFNVKADF